MKRVFGILALALATHTAHAAELPDVNYFIGRWGVVAFNNEKDLMPMAGVARGFCGGLAYHIKKKSDDTFMMYVEDKMKDVKLYSEGGKTYIVPAETPKGIYEGAREVNIVNDRTFTLEYLESTNNARYGKNVFTRCR